MSGENAIKVEGVIVEALPNGTYRVELTNGHRLLAFVAGRARLKFARLLAGERVALELSPYDLSKGRIVVQTQTV